MSRFKSDVLCFYHGFKDVLMSDWIRFSVSHFIPSDEVFLWICLQLSLFLLRFMSSYIWLIYMFSPCGFKSGKSDSKTAQHSFIFTCSFEFWTCTFSFCVFSVGLNVPEVNCFLFFFFFFFGFTISSRCCSCYAKWRSFCWELKYWETFVWFLMELHLNGK